MPRSAQARENTPLSNAEIADRIASLAQLLSIQKENPYKVRAYQRAAARIRNLSESLDEMVREEADLTRFPGIGDAIAGVIREIVMSGSIGKLDKLRAEATPAVVDLSEHPKLDPRRVMRVYKKLGIGSITELREQLENGSIERVFGSRMAEHIRQALVDSHAMLLYRADDLASAVEMFLLDRCKVSRAEPAGDYRRRREVIDELVFVVESADFGELVTRMQRFGGRTPLVSEGRDWAVFAVSSGIRLRLQRATQEDWGSQMVSCTGSAAHLKQFRALARNLQTHRATESELYRAAGLQYIEPELREGHDEVERARAGTLPQLVELVDIRGDFHAHTFASDGRDSIETMADAARSHGYEYVGISDHSQSLKIARGLSIEEIWTQIRAIDTLNSKMRGIRILKSAEVDILADGSLDYPDEVLKELDYTVCSIHSRFGMDREAQTERVLKAMDNRYFTMLGHATGRLLLKRPGYELDMDRIIEQAWKNGCFFEINSSPDRLDLGADNVRQAHAAGVKIAINTDAHSRREFDLIRYGLDQARRAGLSKADVLNCRPLEELERLFRR